MAERKHKSILFLCTGNYYRSRFAEVLFNAAAGKMGLPWRASSRALALELGVNNVGPMSAWAVQALEARGIRAPECQRLPQQTTLEDLDKADLVIALKEAEHRPFLLERFALYADRVEYWHVDDAPEVLDLLEREVMDLMARLLGGGKTQDSVAATVETTPKKPKPAPKLTACVGRETKGRRGKGVTTIWDLPLDEAGLQELAARLKEKCGTGGTVKDKRIEIQGDQRERIITELESRGYKVKRVGG